MTRFFEMEDGIPVPASLTTTDRAILDNIDFSDRDIEILPDEDYTYTDPEEDAVIDRFLDAISCKVPEDTVVTWDW